MDEPVPDGYVEIRFKGFRRPKRKFYFSEMSSLSIEGEGVVIVLNRKRILYPWTAIHRVDHQYNSLEYVRALKDYQKQHHHNWMTDNAYGTIEGLPGFIWYCGPARDGSDQGCSLMESRQLDDQNRTYEQYARELGELHRLGEDDD